jgi:hypothetical protein
VLRLAATLCLAVGSACTAGVPRQSAAPAGTVIVNARVLDGSGAPARRVAVRILGDRIAEVGAVRAVPATVSSTRAVSPSRRGSSTRIVTTIAGSSSSATHSRS